MAFMFGDTNIRSPSFRSKFKSQDDFIEKQRENIYQAKEKHVKNPVLISIEKNKDYGYIKLTIGKSETSQIRIIPLEKDKTLTMNIGYRWKGFPYPFWLNFKRSTDKDYQNARKVIENRNNP